jgi:small subunit ribosomal protein S19e
MATLYDAPPEALVDALADELAERDAVEPPAWAEYAKTGAGRELPPEQDDFWYRRVASVLRKVAVDGPVGVGSLTTAYGSTTDGSTRYRVAPAHSTGGSGSVTREAIQQLEAEDLLKQAGGEGRQVTADGRSLLDTTAGDVLRELDRPELERYV